MAEPSPTRFARSPDGERIAYRTVGWGGVPILFLHGSNCVDLYWDDPVYAGFMDRLAQAGQVIVFDWRGFGASDALPSGEFPTLEAWADDARVVLDAVGATRAFVLAYNPVPTFGLMFAASHPERTAGLVLVDGWARFMRDDDYPSGLQPDVVDRFLDMAIDRSRSPDGAFDDVPSRAPDPVFAEFRARLARLAGPPDWGLRLTKWAFRLDVRALLPAIARPTLVVQPTRHPYIPAAFGDYLAQHIDGARLVRRSGFENIFFSQQDSDEVAALVYEFVTGAPPAFDRDRSLATVLFTDIVGSTDHASRLGDQGWVDLLTRHDAIIDRELRRFRGRKVNPTGDGMVATFDGPARAVRCAQAISEGTRDLGLGIRAGLHTGEIEHRGADVGGIAVHVASRIYSMAGPHEILASRTVADLALGSNIAFNDRGEHELKGVPGAWHLFSVAG
jgi:class 3 adenylate cyclase